MDCVSLMKKEDRIKEYIAYLDRYDRKLHYGRSKLHSYENSRNVARYYGLSEEDIKNLEVEFSKEEQSNGKTDGEI